MDSLSGMGEFANELLEDAKKMESDNAKADTLMSGGEIVVKQAQENAKGKLIGIHSGLLSNSPPHGEGDQILAEWEKSDPDELVVGWTSDAFYGMLQERGFYHHGSGKFIKNPHLRPAFEEKKEEVFDAMIKKIKEYIK